MSRGKVIALAVVIIVLVTGGLSWYFKYPSQWYGKNKQEVPVVQAIPEAPPTFQSADGSAQLRVPNGAMEPETKVAFTPLEPDMVADLNKTARGVIAAGTSVDIKATQGALAPEKVQITLRYDPTLIPQGLSDRQVGMMVFDETLQSWVPLMDAKVDPVSHTVTAIAPHFSWFSTVVLDPLKSAVDVAGKVVQTVIDIRTSVDDWFKDLSLHVVGEFVKDLFGIPDDLSCKTPVSDVTVKTVSQLDLLKACTQKGDGKDVTVILRNGFAFPMRTEKLPAGIAVRASDVWRNGDDLANLVRNWYWSSHNQVVLNGSVNGSVTATADLKSSATVKMTMDDMAIPFDMAMALLVAIAPEASVAKSAVKSSVESVAKGGAAIANAGKALGWMQAAQGVADCLINAAHVDASKVFTKDGIGEQANAVYGCLGTAMDKLHLKGALDDLIGEVKIFPETVATIMYPVINNIGQQLGLIKQEWPTAVVTRQTQSDSTFVGHWVVHGLTMDINKDGTGGIQWNAGPCESSTASVSQLCSGNATIKFTSGPNGTLRGTYTKVWYTDSGGNTITNYPYASSGYQVGQGFTLKRNDPHTLIASGGSADDPDGPGNPYLCDQYAMARNVGGSPYSICGA